MGTKKQIVVLLNPVSNSDMGKYWHIINEDELGKWLHDGSIDEGDKIVYPDRIMDVILKKELKCVKRGANE